MVPGHRGDPIGRPLRVLHVVPSFYPATYHGGPIYSLYALCNGLAERGVEVRVLTTDDAGPERIRPAAFPERTPAGYDVYFCRRLVGASVAPGLLARLPALLRWPDVVHLTAVYSFPTIPTLLASRIARRPVVWSPRGSLQRWSGTTNPVPKAAIEALCRLVARGVVMHVTSEEEGRATAARFPGATIAVVPNGVDVPAGVKRVPNDGRLRLLHIGRLDPKKGIENLLEACRRLDGNGGPPWELTIAGRGEPAYTRSVRERIDALGLSSRVTMVGEVLGDAKRAVFEDADIAVVPSHVENFAMVVAEALAHAVPVIASRGTPWPRVEAEGCGLWVENDPATLAAAIRRAVAMPLAEMGRRGRLWMQREFAWPAVVERMVGVYESVVGRTGAGTRPARGDLANSVAVPPRTER